MKPRKYLDNEYIKAEDVWVRNFCLDCKPISITNLYSQDDYGLLATNEQSNSFLPHIAEEKIKFKKAIIVSDGYNFNKRHLLLEKFPNDICILAVNRALASWELVGKKSINAYVVNNPYKECLNLLPKNHHYPKCIASLRTNREFVKSYKNDIYAYCPTLDHHFGLEHHEKYFVDDYRSPICAAIALAYQFGVEKLMLMCCDDSFKDKRDFAVQLENNLWTYPQNLKLKSIVDANLYWLGHQTDKEVKIADWSDAGYYANATYINSEKEALDFFIDEDTNAE